jgi:hypothetical protein
MLAEVGGCFAGVGGGAIAVLVLVGCWRVRGERLTRAVQVLCGMGDRIALVWLGWGVGSFAQAVGAGFSGA